MTAPRLATRLAGLGCVAALAGCAPVERGPAVHAYLFEKGEYQAIYAPNGRVLRLLQDADRDGRADGVVVYEPDGTRRAEVDTDKDGVVDRWEVYDERSRVTRVGQARRTPGQLDLWEVLDARGAVRARELDESGDGRTDRVERFDASGLVAVELDTGGDGQIDRWQRWEAARLVSEDLDIDADGRADRRLTYDANGVPRLLKLDGADARQRP